MLRKPTFWALSLVTLFAACASAGSGGRDSALGAYTHDLGTATNVAVVREAEQILQRFGYQIHRADIVTDRLRLETQWLVRDPYQDERLEGITSARSRIIITTRPRGTTNSNLTPLTAVTMQVEVQYISGSSRDWMGLDTVSPEMSATVKRIADAFRLELQVKGMEG